MCLTEKKPISCVLLKNETQNKGKRYVLRSVKKERKAGKTRGITRWKKKKGKRRRGNREKKKNGKKVKNEKERVIHIVIHRVDNFFLTRVEEKKKA